MSFNTCLFAWKAFAYAHHRKDNLFVVCHTLYINLCKLPYFTVLPQLYLRTTGSMRKHVTQKQQRQDKA